MYILEKSIAKDRLASVLVLSPTRVAVVERLAGAARKVELSSLRPLGYAFVSVANLKRAGWRRGGNVAGLVSFPDYVSVSEQGEVTVTGADGTRLVGVDPVEFKGLARIPILTASRFETYCRALSGLEAVEREWCAFDGHV